MVFSSFPFNTINLPSCFHRAMASRSTQTAVSLPLAQLFFPKSWTTGGWGGWGGWGRCKVKQKCPQERVHLSVLVFIYWISQEHLSKEITLSLASRRSCASGLPPPPWFLSPHSPLLATPHLFDLLILKCPRVLSLVLFSSLSTQTQSHGFTYYLRVLMTSKSLSSRVRPLELQTYVPTATRQSSNRHLRPNIPRLNLDSS